MKKIRIIDCAAFTFVSAAHLAMAAWLWQPPMAPVIPDSTLSFVDLAMIPAVAPLSPKQAATPQKTVKPKVVTKIAQPSKVLKAERKLAATKPAYQVPTRAEDVPKLLDKQEKTLPPIERNKPVQPQAEVTEQESKPSAKSTAKNSADDKRVPTQVKIATSAAVGGITKAASHVGGHLNNLPPKYPQLSLEAGEEGSVSIRAVVEASGQASSVSLVRGSGHRRLDIAALSAAKKYRFSPATQEGKPIRFVYTFNLNFRMP